MKGKEKLSADQQKVFMYGWCGSPGHAVRILSNLRSKRRWWSLFSNALNIALVAAFKIHKNLCTDQMSYLDIRVEVSEVMALANHETQRVLRWSNCSSLRAKRIRWSKLHLGTNISWLLHLLQN